MEPLMSAHESAARERKIRKLVDEIDRQARAKEIDTHSRMLAEFVASIDTQLWGELAASIKVNPPSETTRLAIVAIYIARADALTERAAGGAR
jgi:hypothetical protein